jgi:tRNA modification GTPase
VQAESVLDIVRSETEEELRCALQYLTGKVSERLNLLKEQIKDSLVLLEAAVDFPEEEIFVDTDLVRRRIRGVMGTIEELLQSFHEGRAVKEGLELLIVGRPNVGKSSLLNALLRKDRAIVTPIPGTTRDLIEDVMYIKGIKVRVVDSCGIREPSDPVEEEGVRRVKERIGGVDLILFVLDGSEPYSEEDERILAILDGRKYITVVNKIDLPQGLQRDVLERRGVGWLEVSATNEVGIAELRERIYETLMGSQPMSNKILITNARHVEALKRTEDVLKKALEGLERGLPPEFSAFDLYEALHHLSELTGETAREDLIDEIFERFCIGK